MPLTVEEANARLLPFARLMGVRFTEVGPERVVAELPVREDLCTRPAVAHGGALMAFADTVGAVATVANLAEGDGTTTIESKTNFVGPAPVGTLLVATATPVHRGGRTQVWQTRIEAGEGRLVALTSQTQLVLRAAKDDRKTPPR